MHKSIERLEREHYEREERAEREHRAEVAERVAYNERLPRGGGGYIDHPSTEVDYSTLE